VRKGDYASFKEYSKLIQDRAQNLCTLRGLFGFKKAEPFLLPRLNRLRKS
jgi:hypothetical protein